MPLEESLIDSIERKRSTVSPAMSLPVVSLSNRRMGAHHVMLLNLRNHRAFDQLMPKRCYFVRLKTLNKVEGRDALNGTTLSVILEEQFDD
ncbi:MAG TPA: hypothetical protein DCX06_04385 [Opitutae bacterium]|nr:hypothetical protein [Opitutae bacterium]